jgi:hypothetical protein
MDKPEMTQEEMKRRIILRFIEKPELIDKLIKSLEETPEEWRDDNEPKRND